MSLADHNSKSLPDGVTVAMQDEIIRIATLRLGRPLPPEIINLVRINRWGYMGLESIIDSVKSMEMHEIEEYLSGLK